MGLNLPNVCIKRTILFVWMLFLIQTCLGMPNTLKDNAKPIDENVVKKNIEIINRELNESNKQLEILKTELIEEEKKGLLGEECLSETEKDLLLNQFRQKQIDTLVLELELKRLNKGISAQDRENEGENEHSMESQDDGEQAEPENQPNLENYENLTSDHGEGLNLSADESYWVNIDTFKTGIKRKQPEDYHEPEEYKKMQEPLTEQVLSGLKMLEEILNRKENLLLHGQRGDVYAPARAMRGSQSTAFLAEEPTAELEPLAKSGQLAVEQALGRQRLLVDDEEAACERDDFAARQEQLLIAQEQSLRLQIEQMISEDDDYYLSTHNLMPLHEKINLLYGIPSEPAPSSASPLNRDFGSPARSNLRAEAASHHSAQLSPDLEQAEHDSFYEDSIEEEFHSIPHGWEDEDDAGASGFNGGYSEAANSPVEHDPAREAGSPNAQQASRLLSMTPAQLQGLSPSARSRVERMQKVMVEIVRLGNRRLQLISEKNNRELHVDWILVGLNRGAFGEGLAGYFRRTVAELREQVRGLEQRIAAIESSERGLNQRLNGLFQPGEDELDQK